MPQAPPAGCTADEQSMWQYTRASVTFVQEHPSQRPFVLVGGELQVPSNASTPTNVVMVWAADQLPDVANLAQANTAGSAELFFSQQYAPCKSFFFISFFFFFCCDVSYDYIFTLFIHVDLHPAIYIDARHASSSRVTQSAVSTYLAPARYVVVRLQHLGSLTTHQLQALRFVGCLGENVLPSCHAFTAAANAAINSLAPVLNSKPLVVQVRALFTFYAFRLLFFFYLSYSILCFVAIHASHGIDARATACAAAQHCNGHCLEVEDALVINNPFPQGRCWAFAAVANQYYNIKFLVV